MLSRRHWFSLVCMIRSQCASPGVEGGGSVGGGMGWGGCLEVERGCGVAVGCERGCGGGIDFAIKKGREKSRVSGWEA